MHHISRLNLMVCLLCLMFLASCGQPVPTAVNEIPATTETGTTIAPASTTPPKATESAAPSVTPPPTAAPTAPPETVALSVFCAGSLMIPFFEIEAAYEAAHPRVDVLIETHGSIQCIRHVTDIHEKIDVVASADHALLSMLMYNTLDPDTGEPYADWNIKFARNHLTLAYDPQQTDRTAITSDNWVELISQPGVRLGLADPRFDACGYRQLMILQLAGEHYGQPRLFNNLIMGRFVQPITTERVEGRTLIHVPEILEPRHNSTILMRGSSVQLIPLLQSGDVAYIIEYESVARQHGLNYVPLPDEINLGDPAQNDNYAQVEVKLDFRRFASVDPVFLGEAITYGMTIPSNAPQPNEAAQFIAFVLGPEGRAIMERNHHPLLSPASVDHPENLPEVLQPLVASE